MNQSYAHLNLKQFLTWLWKEWSMKHPNELQNKTQAMSFKRRKELFYNWVYKIEEATAKKH